VDVEINSLIFFTSALVGGEWSASRSGRFTPGTHWTGDWEGPSAGLDDVEKRKFLTLPELELQPRVSRNADYARPAPLRCQYLDYMSQNCRMNNELERIWKEAVVA
jgi:hypothetical protein